MADQPTAVERYVREQMAMDPEEQQGNWTMGHLFTFAHEQTASLRALLEIAERQIGEARAEIERRKLDREALIAHLLRIARGEEDFDPENDGELESIIAEFRGALVECCRNDGSEHFSGVAQAAIAAAQPDPNPANDACDCLPFSDGCVLCNPNAPKP